MFRHKRCSRDKQGQESKGYVLQQAGTKYHQRAFSFLQPKRRFVEFLTAVYCKSVRKE